MYKAPLVPPDFDVPQTLRAEEFLLRPLGYEVMMPDYEAVVLGARSIALAYEREESYYRAFTLQDEIVELGWHMGEWRRRKSFAYALMSPEGSSCLGSFYLYPTFKRDFDAMGIMWSVPDAGDGFDERAFRILSTWAERQWPFAAVGFPGRRVSWSHWHALAQ